MNNIIFKISKNILYIDSYNKDKKEDLNNTNIINTKEIYFSKIYIIENLELVSSFLNVIIIKQNVNKVIIKNYDIIILVLDIINNIPNIKELDIRPDKSLTYDMFIKILDNEYLNKINAYDIPKYLLERLDINKNINVNIRSEILFVSNFMNDNNLSTYSDIYYQKSIIINKFEDNDINDFISFMKINNHLRVVEFNYFDEDLFKLIMDNIISLNKSNIKIILNEKNMDIKNVVKIVTHFKDKNKNYLNNNKINFDINYSDEYIRDNTFKQINLNVIKNALIVIIITVIIMMFINIFNNQKDDEKSSKIENHIQNIISNLNDSNNDNKQYIEYIEPNNDDLSIIRTTTTSIYDIKYKMIFNELKEINNDTVGYLKVNNTNIDYPVVQSKDNDYYLKNDYYKASNRHGWIFMDYRNNSKNLDKNTIIYGHNLANQKMFGTLRYALNSAWYNKTINQIITFNTPEKNMNWQIFSIYKVPVTTDYLKTSFTSDEDYLDFIKLIKERSINDFNIDVTKDDKILTLSTCSNGHDQRLVLHAKLIVDE